MLYEEASYSFHAISSFKANCHGLGWLFLICSLFVMKFIFWYAPFKWVISHYPCRHRQFLSLSPSPSSGQVLIPNRCPCDPVSPSSQNDVLLEVFICPICLSLTLFAPFLFQKIIRWCDSICDSIRTLEMFVSVFFHAMRHLALAKLLPNIRKDPSVKILWHNQDTK